MPLLLLLISPALAICDGTANVSSISANVSSAQLAMAGLDTDDFAAAVADARVALGCVTTPLNPLDAAAYHTLMGLDAFMGGKEDSAARSFQTVLAITPDFQLPAIIAPANGPLAAIIGKARTLPASTVESLPPFDGIVRVDGVTSFTRPNDRPCVLQLVTTKGIVSNTYYLAPGDALPRWAPPPTAFQRVLPKLREKPSIPFAIAAGTTAAAAGTLYALGGTWHADYLDPATPYENLDGLRAQSDAALGTSIALGIAAAALTTVTIVHW